jgi:heme/copper-type cytochrome/quinol oxidase subunit 2
MRLEGWHAMLFLAMLVMAVVVVVAVTLIVVWTVRWANKRNSGGGPGSSLP